MTSRSSGARGRNLSRTKLRCDAIEMGAPNVLCVCTVQMRNRAKRYVQRINSRCDKIVQFTQFLGGLCVMTVTTAEVATALLSLRQLNTYVEAPAFINAGTAGTATKKKNLFQHHHIMCSNYVCRRRLAYSATNISFACRCADEFSVSAKNKMSGL